jgi:hypothetical protein
MVCTLMYLAIPTWWYVMYFCFKFRLVYVTTHPRRIAAVYLQHIRYFTVFITVVTFFMSLVEGDVYVLASAVAG